jgi:hypothetical protein
MSWTSGLGIQADAQRALDIQKATPGEKAMSEETEIEFETMGSEHWDLVRVDARREASQRIQDRYDLVIEGSKLFETDAGTAITTYITKPPEHISGFGAIFESVMAACLLLVPEVGLAAEVAKKVKEACERQADQAHADFAALESNLEAIYARQPGRRHRKNIVRGERRVLAARAGRGTSFPLHRHDFAQVLN